jgi:hypothetical protein
MKERKHRSGIWMAAAASIIAVSISALSLFSQEDPNHPGFDDTPYLPGGKWRVHDSRRPHPPIIQPGTSSSQNEPGKPPSDAIVLFDGTDLSKWEVVKPDGSVSPAQWKVQGNYMEVAGGTGSIQSKEKFGDCQIHVEWTSPTDVKGESQGRGNSGVIIMGNYEIQVLDMYDNLTYADGQASAMYGQYPPMVNPARKPGEWQSYDIIFEAPVFDGEKVMKPAYVTVLFNGVVVQNHRAFIGRMTYRQVATYAPHPPEGPLMLQDHGNPVRYRNIWVRRLGGYDQSNQ